MAPTFPRMARGRHAAVSDHAPSYRDPFAPVGKEKHWRSLKPADELALILRYQRGEQLAGRELLCIHRRLIYAIARRYFHATLDPAELVQVCAIGFLKGAAHYDHDKARGGRLVPYARWWARAEVAEFALAARRFIRISPAQEQAIAFLAKHGPDNPKSRAYLRSIALRDALLVEERILSLEGAALEADDDDGAAVHPLEAFLASEEDSPETRVSLAEEAKKNAVAVHAALMTLSEREKTVLLLRCMTEPPAAVGDVGTLLGISHDRVRFIQAAALKKMEERIKLPT